MKNILKIVAWYSLTNMLLFSVVYTYNNSLSTTAKNNFIRQQNSIFQTKSQNITFASIPTATLEIKTAISSKDARPMVINNYLKRWGSPMENMGEYIVKTADKYNIDPYLIVAIAQQESNLGKKIPPNCFNAWGWGIHSKGTLCFSNWYEAIDTFAKGIAESYYAYGLYTPDEIMTKYVPHSPNGAWAKGVNQFLGELRNGNF